MPSSQMDEDLGPHFSTKDQPYCLDQNEENKPYLDAGTKKTSLNHTRFERITFRSGVERATVAPAVPSGKPVEFWHDSTSGNESSEFYNRIYSSITP